MRQKSWDLRPRSSVGAFFFGVTLAAVWVAGWLHWMGLAQHVAVAQDTSSAFMASPDWPAVSYYELTNVRVVDGDTLEADINFPMNITLRSETIRCSDYDAWESSKRRRSVTVTDDEVAMGKSATAALNKLLSSGSMLVQLESNERDVYGRVLARLFVRSEGTLVSVASWMKEQGHVREEEGNG